jgi:hypothetical protein
LEEKLNLQEDKATEKKTPAKPKIVKGRGALKYGTQNGILVHSIVTDYYGRCW